MVEQAVNMILFGAGNRGCGVFGQYALDVPHRAKFTVVVEPDESKRKFFAKQHHIPAERTFCQMEGFFGFRY